jgi:putative colanic acid biosynthesis acetyltransferase WcaF
MWLAGVRATALRLFGGRIGRGCRLARSARITIPWTVTIGNDVELGERAIVYSLGEITIGDGVVLDFRAHLCAGTHDMSDPRFPLIKPPISIGAGSFIGMDAYVGPNVVLGERCRVGARASVFKSFPADTVLEGNPARPVEGGGA